MRESTFRNCAFYNRCKEKSMNFINDIIKEIAFCESVILTKSSNAPDQMYSYLNGSREDWKKYKKDLIQKVQDQIRINMQRL